MVRYNELRAARVRAGKTQKEAAHVCGCSINTYGKKEQGKASFTLDEVVLLCDFLGIRDPEERAYIFLA